MSDFDEWYAYGKERGYFQLVEFIKIQENLNKPPQAPALLSTDPRLVPKYTNMQQLPSLPPLPPPPPNMQPKPLIIQAPKPVYLEPDHIICIDWLKNRECPRDCKKEHKIFPLFKTAECKYYSSGNCKYSRDSTLCSHVHGKDDPHSQIRTKRGRYDY